jgi:methionine-rich copper-binding protein CopC
VTKIIAFFAALFLLSASYAGYIGAAVPASAHADLVSTDPVDGAVLQRAPESITLSFNSKILEGMAELAVTNSVGELVTGVVAQSAQTTATALWPVGLPGDTYKVAYRIVSEDGHPITGSFSFSYPASETTAPSDSVADSTAVEPQVSAIQTPSEEPAPVVPVSTESSTEAPSDSGSMLVWVLGFLALALVVAGYFIWRKRST